MPINSTENIGGNIPLVPPQDNQDSQNVNLIKEQLKQNGFNVGEGGIQIGSTIDANGNEIYSISGSVPPSQFADLISALKEINAKRGIQIDDTALNTLADEMEKAADEAKLSGALTLTLPVNIAFHSVKNGLENPWLVPNGLVALSMALMELAMVQTQIKVDSSKMWRENQAAAFSLAKDAAGLILIAAEAQAQIHRNEAKVQRQEAVTHLASAITAGASLGMSLGFIGMTARGAQRQMTKLEQSYPGYTNAQSDVSAATRQKNNNTFYKTDEGRAFLEQKRMIQGRTAGAMMQAPVFAQLSSQVVNNIMEMQLSYAKAEKEEAAAGLVLEKAQAESLLELVRVYQKLHNDVMQHAESWQKDADQNFNQAMELLKKASETSKEIWRG